MPSNVRQLKQQQARIASEARAKINEIKDDTTKEGAAEIEREFDAMMERYDDVQARIDNMPDPRRPRGENGEARGVDDGGVWANFRDGLRGTAELRNVMATSSGPNGGFVVPKEIDSRILNQLVDISPVRSVAEVVNISTSDYEKIVNRRGTASGWGNEHSTRTDTDAPILAKIAPPAGELWAKPVVTNHFLDDAMFSAESFLNENVATEFAFQEGSAFINGDGIDKPRGFLTYTTAATADASRDFGTLEHLAAASATVITADELIQLLYKLKPAYRQGGGAAWMMNSTTSSVIRRLKDGQGRYLWADGLTPGQPPQLLGYPVVEAEDMPDIATGTLPIAFGNWRRGYIITDRIGMTLIRDNITQPGWTKFYFAKRVGGAVTDSNALKLLKMA